MSGYRSLRQLLDYEFIQSREEGKEPAALALLRQEFMEAGEDEKALERVWEKLMSLPTGEHFRYEEPDDLAAIRALRADEVRRYPRRYGADVLYDRMYGAWLGRCAGCALGKPVEGFMNSKGSLASKARIKLYLQAVSEREYPLRDYFPERSPAEDSTGKVGSRPSTREHIAYMQSDDDIRYTVIGQLVMATYGATFTSWDVARTWISKLPYRLVATAETQAYRNLVGRYSFHYGKEETGETVDWRWVATHQNPYREWIGAQIRADAYGYAAPGQPQLAAEFAWRDARVSHVKNGLYGEMFVAAMIAAAFTLDDPLHIVEAGLAEIPQTSRLHAGMLKALAICRTYDYDPDRFEEVLEDIYEAFGHYDPVHTINNAALVVTALLLGGHDFEKAITIAVMGGWDTDCNGATAGSIVGAMLGARRLPERWIQPLHDTLNSKLSATIRLPSASVPGAV